MGTVTTRKGKSAYFFPDGAIYYASDSKGREIDLKRGRYAFDDISDIADSTYAARVISALRSKLDPADMDRILKVMKDAGLVTDRELESLGEEDSDKKTNERLDDDMASDSMFPHMSRLGRPEPAYGQLRGPAPRVMSAAEQREHDQMFPDAGRLKS